MYVLITGQTNRNSASTGAEIFPHLCTCLKKEEKKQEMNIERVKAFFPGFWNVHGAQSDKKKK